MSKKKRQVEKLFFTAGLMILGLLIFKWFLMSLYGSEILYDASAHLTIAVYIMYIIYYFIDQNKSWRVPFFIFCFMVLTIISLQRIVSNAHNDVGLLMGLIISIISIAIPNWKEVKKRIEF